MQAAKLSGMLFWLCLTVVVIVPFANDMFIAALPAMQVFFNTKHMALAISAFLLGLALAQPIYGPLSDRFGRKPVLLSGLFIFVLGSSMTLLAHDFYLFLLARFIQALGACSAIVSALAMLRDTQDEQQLVRSVGVLMAIVGVCPAMAPLLGAMLTELFSWYANFVFLWLLGVFYLLVIAVFFRETQEQKNLQALTWYMTST